MDHNLENIIAFLTRTPATLDALLRDLPENWTHSNEGDGTWSVFDVLGHLIHAERTDWLPRANIILEYGEARTFAPFDRSGHAQEIQGKSLAQLLDEFARVRSENLDKLRAKTAPRILSAVEGIQLWALSLWSNFWLHGRRMT